jgi:hypothetical protein
MLACFRQVPPSKGISAGQLTLGKMDSTNCLEAGLVATVPFITGPLDYNFKYLLQVDS